MHGHTADSEPTPYDGPEGEPPAFLYTLDVDGELFSISARDGGTDYGWISGPNKDYGFSSSESPDMPCEEHVDGIRAFLGMIDPATGYIADD